MKKRLDLILVERELLETREKAKREIMAGNVIVNEQVVTKAGTMFKDDDDLNIRIKNKLKYVSRGGLKLEKALQVFDLSVDGATTIDIGASTGGFTDVMLQNGADLVFAVDVGTNQLAWKLRQDPRVVSMEQFNFRYAEKTDFEQEPSFASIDVSFISLSLILPALHRVLADQGQVVALVKPQFEAGREQIGKNGIIRDAKVHQHVLESVTTMSVEEGFSVLGLDFSPIQGGHGNIEFLAYLKKEESAGNQVLAEIEEVVERAHSQFKNE